METGTSLKIMMVAGEASGDAHAARLAAALRDAAGHGTVIELFGCAGPQMRNAGVEAVVEADELAIMGVPEIARALPNFFRVFRRLKKAAAERRPDCAILIDFPEFNLKLAKSLKKQGIRVVYYISPQLWAWRQYRKRTIAKDVDLLLSILPFEKNWYAERGINNVRYVGNPLAGEVKASVSRAEFCREFGLREGDPIIALLPGSRRKEIFYILPEMLAAAGLIQEKMPETQFVIAQSSERRSREVGSAINDASSLPKCLVTVVGRTYDVVASSDAAAVASGTATLEAGLLGTPMVVVYKGSSLNYRLLRPLIDVEHFGLINLIAQKRIATELIQDDLSAETLAFELEHLLDAETNIAKRQQLAAAAAKLGSGGASAEAAAAILELLSSRHP